MKGIVLLAMARSRSSMTAEIFRRHGVFFGHTLMDGGPPGAGYNENLALKRLSRKARGDFHDLLLAGKDGRFRLDGFPEVWRGILEAEGYESGPWGAKADAFCDQLFDDIPHVKIGIWRNPDAIVRSCLRSLRPRVERDWRKIVGAHHELLWGLGIPMIDTDAVVRGDHATLERAFEVCDLEYDPAITGAIVRRG